MAARDRPEKTLEFKKRRCISSSETPHGRFAAARPRVARVLHAVRTRGRPPARAARAGRAAGVRTPPARVQHAVRAPVRNLCVRGGVHLHDQFVQRGLYAHLMSSSSSSSQYENLNPSSHSSSSDSPMHFTANDIPEISSSDDVLPVEETPDAQISLPTIGVPSYTEAFAQLRDTVDEISIEQVQTRFHLDELKAALSKRISNLETEFITASDNQDRTVLVQTSILRKEMQDQKAALSEELADIRQEIQDQKAAIVNDLLEFLVETQENYNTLRAHLAEIIAYINRVRDDKKREVSTSRGPQPPQDRSRPGSRDSGRGRGSSSEPSRKRGSGCIGGGSTSCR
ncbi:kinesin-3 [Dorcoceras hygrometricum]|uniref:Kinesin-3 n=1 Tax=Dorcoceras hygrometricum TaxID=472368 RepID=A0A2Z7DF02_9LAMI|nr:kinesin-3 [Dorcoceras hygrometricum]